MLNLSSSYCHGYIATPIIEACQQRGLFKLLDTREFRERTWLITELKANAGYFTIALEAMESLGWLEKNSEDAYRLATNVDNHRYFGLMPLYAIEPEKLMMQELAARTLAEKIEEVFFRAGVEETAPERGAIMVPLVVSLQSLDAERFSQELKVFGPNLSQTILELFAQQQWLTPDKSQLTASAKALLQQSEFNVVMSYRPLLHAIGELLFGDHARAFEGARNAIWAAGLQHHTLSGHMNEPDELERAPEKTGVPPELEAVHLPILINHPVRVDRKRPINPALSVLAPDQPAWYLDQQGQLVDAMTVLSCWQQHLRLQAQTIHDSRLLILEAHAVSSQLTGQKLDKPDVLYSEVVHRLAHEHLISAEALIILAATVGLFNESSVKRYPVTSDPCRVSFHSFAKRDYIVRHATESDLEPLSQLERLCWQHTRTSSEQIQSRLQTYPQGQFILEKEGKVLGVVYSQRIADTDELLTCDAANVHHLHNASGSVVQLLAVNIDPEAQNRGYGDQLLEFMLQRCSLMAGIDEVAGVTLCKNYHAEASLPFAEYIHEQGPGQDRILAFHQAHGAEIVQAIAGYRPQDKQNQGNGVLVSYDILNRMGRRRRDKAQAKMATASGSGTAEVDQRQISDWVQREAAQILGVPESELDIDRPVMEMGLDSADLLKWQQLLEDKYGLTYGTGFFFEHNSIKKVIDYLTATIVTSASGSQRATSMPSLESSGKDKPLSPVGARHAYRPATDIAIVGMSCKLPGGIETPEQLWEVLASEKNMVSAFPRTRGGWPTNTERPGIEQGGFIHDIDGFDASFFRISPAEARRTDPQQRILLELAWACLEDAGKLPAALKGTKVGVFVGASNCDYSRLVQQAGLEVEAHHGVGSSLALVANRLSYFYDLSGPSVLIDTACSSSLVALHTAIQFLRSGECTAALVGGVNIICHPDLSIAYHKAGMLAPDGVCKVFDARADGYVRSEGAVMLLLKPVERAIAEGDRIHAVIKGSAINHGGLAAGLTVPNPQKQSELLQAGWKNAGIAPEEVTYIEAHGTGTSLGDPIEIQGIQTAYGGLGPTREAKACAIGSVKSNLGHLESAAGITGLLKVIVSMQHQQLPATINFAQLNPKIRLEGTPFYIQERRSQWDVAGPRLAAVSSFGSGGANAHIVVQEHVRKADNGSREEEYLFVLSATEQDRLREYVSRVIGWLESGSIEAGFRDAIYSWQVGRTAMKQRLAVKVTGPVHLLTKLRQWLIGDSGLGDVWSGPAIAEWARFNRVWRSTSGQQLIDRALTERDLEQLAIIWTSGIDLEWRKLYAASTSENHPQCISLPTYPFAKERYWIDVSASAAAKRGTAVLHPLLHSNTSDLSEQCYRSTFTGEEFFLTDHQVKTDKYASQKVLPGVAYLEMARAAMERASPARPDATVLELHNTVWAEPIVVSENKQVSIALLENEHGQIDYEVFSHGADQEIVHCQGRAVWSGQAAPSGLDLDQLRAQMGQGQIEPDSVYPAFAWMGLVYGPSFQAITKVHRGNGQVLANLQLPSIVADTWGDYVLHPSLIDGAVQAALGFINGESEVVKQPRLPFALDLLRIVSPCAREMCAWVRYSPGSQTGDEVVKLDIDLCDDRGTVCVQMRGFSSRVLSKEISTTAAQGQAMGTLLAAPVWQASAVEVSAVASNIEHHLVLCELPKIAPETLRSLLAPSQCLILQAGAHRNIAQRYSEYALACFERIQIILQGKPRGRVLLHLVVAGHQEQALFAGLSGLLKTAVMENPQLIGQLILVPADMTTEELAGCLQQEKTGQWDSLVKYEQGARQVLHWQEVAVDPEMPPIAFKDQGVYLITGGLGSLGILFAKEILAQTREGRVVLTGRSLLSAENQELLDGLSMPAGRLSYRQVDLDDLDQVKQLIASIKEEHHQLNGILHSAGMIAFNSILKKTSSEFSQVLAPKVTGTYNLDQASRDVELDFLVLFSSVAGATGNPRTADYAAANGFMDQFATYRNEQVAAQLRHGHTRSINWPWWQAGGMSLDRGTQERLQQTTGMQPMQTATGMQAFYRSLALPYDQMLVAEGMQPRLTNYYLQKTRILKPPSVTEELNTSRDVSSSDPSLLPGKLSNAATQVTLEQLEQRLKTILATVLGITTPVIDVDQAFVELGLDSLLGTGLVLAINEEYGSELSNIIVFDYPTIRELALFLEQELRKLVDDSQPVPAPPKSPLPVAGVLVSLKRKVPGGRTAASHQAPSDDRIAIIGMSLKYPQANNAQEFWGNLVEGRNSIVEVPPSRWDVNRYYDPDPAIKDKANSKWLGALDDIDCFDPLFFRISPQDADYIDPHHRLFLQESYKAFEDAGYSGNSLGNKKCGVYLGFSTNEYALLLSKNGVLAGAPATSNHPAIAAARIAYYLNLKGPAISVDTACSSSLVAIHLACQGLLRGETEMALAGGITLWLAPEFYLSMSQAGMFSSVGQCKTFDDSADGMVNGEGVGAVVLKRLKDAQADNDFIYGVILGSGINQDGKTNGITAPSVNSQIELERAIYARQKIDPETITYVETHGTGTRLGDPIELEALATVFREGTTRKNFCALGSVKSNIGHTTAAAGVAGVHKVLLSMQHRTLVPTLHVTRETSRFDFKNSPFYISRETKPWDVTPGSLRRAAVSSFGFSGTNAHLVIEEYPRTEQAIPSCDNASFIVALSARTEDQLRQRARDLLEFIRDAQACAPVDLAAVAYTLQVGRDVMEERLGFLVSSVEQLVERLQAYVSGQTGIEDVYQGQVKRNKEALSLFRTDVDLQQTVDKWMANRKLSKLLGLWVKGLELDWSKLYGEAKPQRMSLPTYPFAKERYWMDTAAGRQLVSKNSSTAVLHPLLHSNTSDLGEQRYSSTFTGEEFFLADHQVKTDGHADKKVLPGVAYLEMARAAIEQAWPARPGSTVLELQHTVWAQPIAFIKSRQVSIALLANGQDQIDYEIYSQDGDQEIVHCQGRAVWSGEPAPAKLDLEQLRGEMGQPQLEPVYAGFVREGFLYGPAFQAIAAIHPGSGQVLAHLRLPRGLEETSADYILHPSLMDAAVQASVGLVEGWSELSNQPRLPFALESLRIVSPCTAEMFAWVRPSTSDQATDEVVNLDIDLCDRQGNICIQLREFSTRMADREIDAASGAPSIIEYTGDQIDPEILAEKTQDYLRRQFSGLLKMQFDKIDPQTGLDEYGIDSILAMKLTKQLEETFGPLSKTLFFEHQTIAGLASYFTQAHSARLAPLFTARSNGHALIKHAPPPTPSHAPARLESVRRFNSSRSAGPSPATSSDVIAIIGLSGRYPEAVNIDAYWHNLREGKDCIVEVPKERWEWQKYFSDDRTKSGQHYSKWGGFIAGADEFDPLFFSISPKEAKLIDPQERLFLQHAWMAIEDAGYIRASLQAPAAQDLPGQVGVYAGVTYSEYQLFGAEASIRDQRMGFAASLASIANRVSYAFNLHGPSMTLDTMCSSSLTAIHVACQDLKQGRTCLAIAGGVNLSIHPNKYLVLSAGQFISSDGHCQSFGEGGDGYIPGEGVGVVVLKRLSEAKRDGDHIYGIIRGSALNHGGKTNGYTVPNPQAQASVISRALVEAKVDARQVSYIEAHGTGTKLGDPIEIAALSKAFRQYTQDSEFCLIGSAKSNIGHCESAAGIAGLTKVLLQMQHRQIVPSLHSSQLNPLIDFPNSPFTVNQSLRPWDAPVIDGRKQPRIAGISSFGAGGSNAHMIVEEYESPLQPALVFAQVVILLSARTAEQLRQKALELLEFVRTRESTLDLLSLAYTLQVGREGMEERLGLVVSSVEQLAAKLQVYLDGEPGIEDCYQGQVKRNQEAMSLFFGTDVDLQQTVDKWMANGKLSKLLELWVKGLDLDWSKLYGEVKPRRISLPTYPFAKDRYWIDMATGRQAPANGASVLVLHPLLHSNTSDLSEQRFSSTFTGDEFFLADHQVKADGHATQKVLPGVVYLEMARAAIERAWPARPESTVLELHHTVWAQPLVVIENKQVSIALLANENNQIDYEIYSQDGDQEIVHCHGRAVCSDEQAPARLDLEQIREQVGQGQREPKSVYAAFAQMGLHYGPAHQGITALYLGEKQVLASLRLPAVVAPGHNAYVLHPSLMDGALQACVGLIDGEGSHQPRLPFALELVRIMSPCTPEMFAWARYSPGSEATAKVVKVDIDLCDERGNVCVQMRGFSARVPGTQGQAIGSLLAAPTWQARGVETPAAPGSEYIEHHVILCELSKVNVETLGSLLGHSRCVSLRTGEQKNIAQRYSEYALQCFERIRAILQGKLQGKVLVHIVIAGHREQALFAGLSGLLKTAALENPQLIGQLILVPADMTTEELGRRLQEEKTGKLDPQVKYEQGQRQILRWQEVAPETPPIAFKDHGVYLITGGLGALGVLFAKEILGQTREARVLLTGRSVLSPEKQAFLDGLSVASGRLSYRQVDLDQLDQVRHLIAAVKEEYHQLNGILHSAGMIADNFILKKAGIEFTQVLAPKVTGTYNLDQASLDVELDFFVLFSSVAGAMGNLGQADYAVANGFMDQFAAYRNEQVTAHQRHGRTLSINWPLWQAGGMAMDAATQELVRRVTGMQPMQTATGMQAFYRALALPHDQMLVVEGDLPQLRRALSASLGGSAVPSQAQAQPSPATAEIASENLVEKTQDYLRRQFSGLLKLPSHKIDPHAELERYGIDSIMVMKLTNHLEQTFGTLSKTLFFEYQTIAGLAEYFVKTHPAIVREITGVLTSKAKDVDRTTTEKGRPTPAIRGKNRFLGSKTYGQKDIAIIGVAGRYPQAENLEEFWSNLTSGRDCITEIPLDRWDSDLYYDADRNKAGKSYSKWGGFLADVDKFDPLFFNISPREAELIDPQERLFLQTAWHTIEDAGYRKETLSGTRVGVFVGVMWGQYELLGVESISSGNTAIPSSSHASIANRVSYFFDFHGPSIALDTMCSSSLTAIHLACEELRKGEIQAAIAGGVNLTIHPYKYLSLSQGGFAASDGKCRSFGAGGDGYVPGEGVGAVLLKPLEDALRDGDQIYAVIKASTINHGGKTNGYSVPNPNAQAGLVLDALTKANIDPRTLSYVEAHGTGTSLGDPIEVTGLSKAFEGSTEEKQFCPIGSVKSNIGHLEAAAGIAAVTKALLQIKYKQLVPSLHADPPNPNINFTNSPFYVQTELTEWKRPGTHPRRVAVSSFGAGGSNAHLILEECIDTLEPEQASHVIPREAFVLSARDHAALCRYAGKVVHFLDNVSGVSLASLAYTSQLGRTAMDERLVVIASSAQDLKGKLNQWITLQGKDIHSPDALLGLDDVFYGSIKEAQYTAGTLVEGKAGKHFIEELLANRDLEKIARFWILGLDIDWSLMYPRRSPRRVSLPTYPFAKERCWIDQEPSTKGAAHQRPGEKLRTYYHPQWTRNDLASPGETRPAIGPILILDTGEGLFLTIKERLGSGSIVLVKPGKSFQEIEPNIYTLDPEREEQFHQLVVSLKKKSLLPEVVLHHCSEVCNLDVEQQVARQLNNGVYALLFLCKALMKEKHQGPLKVASAFSSRSEAPAPLGAAMGGFLKTITLENPKYIAKTIEIQKGLEEADLIWEEVRDSEWTTTQEIRYRSHMLEGSQRPARYMAGLVPQTSLERKVAPLPLKHNGVYLITGGLGGLGLIFAEYLAKRFQSKLVLIGRSTPNSKQEAKLSRLKSYGSEILFLQADVSKLGDMEMVAREAKARFSVIDGVIHAAGVNRDSFLLKKTKQEMDAVLAPKVYGAINLDLATSADHLDFFVLFSSIAGVMGNVGQCDYAYGNQFLNSFAESRENLRKTQKRWGRTLSINWPLWEAGGMTISPDDSALLEKQTGICPLPTQEGIRCWEDLLQDEELQPIPLYGIPSRIAAYIARKPAKAPGHLPALVQEDDPATLFEKTVIYLKTLIGEQIKLAPDRIDSSERLESLGIDSMMINRINTCLERDLGALPKTLLYEHETVRDLARFLLLEARAALIVVLGLALATPEPATPPTLIEEEAIQDELSTKEERSHLEPIAVIGIHGYYPHSANLDEYWENLKQGKDLIDLVPADRWDYEEFYHPDPAAAAEGKIYCKWGGFLDNYDKFDPQFFNISREEAKVMDPQERLFLESVWAAVEDAGYTRESLKTRHPKARSADVGVFVGVTTNSYQLWGPEERSRGNIVYPSAMPWSIANRVSYFFDFNGPSMPVDTACSSSLVAVHLACESLKNRGCQIAIAGGVNLYLHPSKYQSLCQRRMLSLGGKCHSYGAGDDGFVPGEGVGTLVLKPLGKAIADQDHIYAVIPASAYDHGGRSNGYSAPNPNSQAHLISRTLMQAGIQADSISYVEGHGTGTQLGDSIEIVALTQAFQKQTSKKQFCSVGSVKANIGHSESAAGIAGLAKIILQLKHRQLAPSIYSDQANPDIAFQESPFYLQHGLSSWEPGSGQPRRALINSFGAGGVNACVILEEYEPTAPANDRQQTGPFVFTLSAKNEGRLRDYADRLLVRLQSEKGIDLAGLCYTLQLRREAMEERLAIVVSDVDELIDRLGNWSKRAPSGAVVRGSLGPRRGSMRASKPTQTTKGEQTPNELAKKWAAGEAAEWESLYSSHKPRWVGLPTYPFARERYWISDSPLVEKQRLVTAQLHPLVSYNSSTLKEVSFSSSLLDTAFYAVDHKVNQERIFPGAGFLEIACIAGNIAGEQRVRKIKDIVWIQPLSFRKGPRVLRTSLKQAGDAVEFVISSLDAENETTIHSEGGLAFANGWADTVDAEDRISIQALKAQCTRTAEGTAYYAEFSRHGFTYGPSFQTIQEIHLGESFALSRLTIAGHLKNEFDQFILHPSMIDGALQTAAGLLGALTSASPHVPFALDEVDIVHPVPQTCYAYARLADSREPKHSSIRKFNIQILNESGAVLINFKNLFVRALDKTLMVPEPPSDAGLAVEEAAAL